MKLIITAALLIAACLISIGVHISNLAIFGVMCTIVYIVSTSIRTIIENRQTANANARQQDALCEQICQGLDKLAAARKIFCNQTSHLSADEQTSLWSSVVDLKVRTCHFMLAKSFPRATDCLNTASEKANSLIAQYQQA